MDLHLKFLLDTCWCMEIEPAHEIMVLFVLRKLILQMHMRSHPVGLDVWFLLGLFVYFWAFAGRLCDKYHNLMSWLNYWWRLWQDFASAQVCLRLRCLHMPHYHFYVWLKHTFSTSFQALYVLVMDTNEMTEFLRIIAGVWFGMYS